MTINGHQETVFGQLLSRAINDTGYSLTYIVEQLALRGQKCTPATLSYWQASRSLPRRRSSLMLLPDLEKVLGMEAGSLSGALTLDMVQEGSTVAPRAALDIGTADEAFLSFANEDGPTEFVQDAALSFTREVQRVSLVEHTIISNNYRTSTGRVTIMARAHRQGGGTLHLGLHLLPGMSFDPGQSSIQQVRGATIAATIQPDDATRIVRLEIPDSVPPYSLWQVSYVNVQHSDDRFRQINERMFPWPLRHYSSAVVFDCPAPRMVEWVQSDTVENGSNGQRIVRVRELELTNSQVQVSLSDVKAGATVIRWML